jgi:hypothetical protein
VENAMLDTINTPVADLEQEAATLSVEDLKVKATAYQELVADENGRNFSPSTDKAEGNSPHRANG